MSMLIGSKIAITRSRGAILATRNAKDFDGCNIEVVNPWIE
jgi:predicted nucleic acid-binding protein